MADRYEVLIIGAGQGGIPLARTLAQRGKRVALAERKQLGGSCVNFGCTPTKAAIASARVAQLARRGNEYGLNIPVVEVDFARVLQRAEDMATRSRVSLQRALERVDNLHMLRGHAHFLGRHSDAFELAVGDRQVVAEKVILDTGTRAARPPIDGARDIDFIDSGNWLQHRRLPGELVVIGGGYIGLEMAQFYRRMGSAVTVVEYGDQIAGHEDRDVADALRYLLESEGIRFHMNAQATRVERNAEGVVVTVNANGVIEELTATDVFLALGRQPNTDDLGLDNVGIGVTAQGHVQVDKWLSTNVTGVWAIGDIRGGPMFTHTAWDDYRIVESQLLGDGSRTTVRVVPYAIFTDPELGRVGLTEHEARHKGYDVRVGHFEMQHNGKARELGETPGFVKVVTDARSKKLLGAAILATEAAELVHLYVELINADAPYTVLERSIYIHPTLAEAVQSAVHALH